MEGDTEIEVLYVATGSSLPSKRHIHYLDPDVRFCVIVFALKIDSPGALTPRTQHATHTHTSRFSVNAFVLIAVSKAIRSVTVVAPQRKVFGRNLSESNAPSGFPHV
jgi:hypothetical protein